MILMVFAVHDRATNQFGTPMFMLSKGQALRSFGDEVNRQDKDNQLCVHTEDFSFHYLGTFDTDNGEFAIQRPEQLALARDLKIKAN